MKGLIKYLVFLVFPVVLVILWLSGIFHTKVPAEEVIREPRTVTGLEIGTVEVLEGTYVALVGRVVAEERVEISTRRAGYVTYVGFEEGDRVRKGQTLLRIDPAEVRSKIEEAKRRVLRAKRHYEMALARYKVAEKTYRRFASLLKEGAVTQQEFDEVEAKFLEAKAGLEAARIQVEIAEKALSSVMSEEKYTEIRAPFDGYVVKRTVDPGDMAVPGRTLMVLERDSYRVRVNVPERFLGSIRLGDRMKVRVESLGRTFFAKVVEIEPSVDPRTRTFRVEARISGGGLRSGMFARVFLPERERILVVPESALYRRWDLTGVWVVDPEGTLSLRFVRTGRRLEGKVEILSGLKEGERIVVRGLERACDGCRVGG
jgi:RND family efflux transporter MFP subunit